MSTNSRQSASALLCRLENPDSALQHCLAQTYGADAAVWTARIDLWAVALQRFIERFGDGPVRLFRAPGRINLRGMHVDTHGGYLNLMTHQREVVAVTSEAPGGGPCTFANIDAAFPEVCLEDTHRAAYAGLDAGWLDFIMTPEVRALVEARRGAWDHYLAGSLLSVRHRFGGRPLCGLNAVVGSDVPRGAALSSSAALCVALTQALLSWNGLELDDAEAILAARDAEWYTGSRCGVSDQAAIVLGGLNEVVNAALFAAELDVSRAARYPFPPELAILVINSFTERSLSGKALVEYTRNRFAYSLALRILRQEMERHGIAPERAETMDRLANITPSALVPTGGNEALLRLLRAVPEELDLDEIRRRYDMPDIEEAYEQYFGTAPPEDRPRRIGLRGPLLFGIAESERARLFPERLQMGDFEESGRLMTIGHGGDRRVGPDGEPYAYDVGDAALEEAIRRGDRIEHCPGVYGASSPVLDFLVDAALGAGALGASLTGAGIAGTVLALCRAGEAGAVAEAVRRAVGSAEYAGLGHFDGPLPAEKVAQSVVVNAATARAGEFRLR